MGSRTVLHFDGSRWTPQDTEEALKNEPLSGCVDEATLRAVFAHTPDDVWAVGYIYPSDDGPGLIVHFDGSSWSRMTVDAESGFHAVWASAAVDAWAMGSSGNAYHYDGESWSGVDLGADQYMLHAWGSARDDVWAAGESATGESATLLHYDDRRWVEPAHVSPPKKTCWSFGPPGRRQGRDLEWPHILGS